MNEYPFRTLEFGYLLLATAPVAAFIPILLGANDSWYIVPLAYIWIIICLAVALAAFASKENNYRLLASINIVLILFLVMSANMFLIAILYILFLVWSVITFLTIWSKSDINNET
mgnify:CR=1 FL=1|tara:strand:+ start:203 stop:547 length:345 start_codon:yes stop_codon:yes gene_type:complete